jgi:RimJ/RimL family protein N-acetyltransferase
MDLRGRLVRLRAPAPEDAESLAAIATHPDVARYAGGPYLRPLSAIRMREWQERRDPDRLTWTVEAVEDRAVLGSCGLTRIDHLDRHCWFQIALGPPERLSRGLGTEATVLATRHAFRQLGMEKVYLGVLADNARGVGAYRKAGYQVEATLRRHQFLEGALRDQHWMAAYRDHPLYAG